MKKTRVLLADDHRIVLEGLRSILESEFEVIGAVEDGRTLVAEAKKLCPDVVVADIALPELNGIDAARQIRKIDERIRVVFLTMHADANYAASAFEAGASGFVLKHSAPQELITALREAMRGRTYVAPMIAGDLIGSNRQGAYKTGELKIAFEPPPTGGAATPGRRKIRQRNRNGIEYFDPDCRIPQIPDDGTAQYQDRRRIGSIRCQAWHNIHLSDVLGSFF